MNRLALHRIFARNLLLTRRLISVVVAAQTVEPIEGVHIVVRVEVAILFRISIDLIEFLLPRPYKLLQLSVQVNWIVSFHGLLLKLISFSIELCLFQFNYLIHEHLLVLEEPVKPLLTPVHMLLLLTVRNVPLDHLHQVGKAVSMLRRHKDWID